MNNIKHLGETDDVPCQVCGQWIQFDLTRTDRPAGFQGNTFFI